MGTSQSSSVNTANLDHIGNKANTVRLSSYACMVIPEQPLMVNVCGNFGALLPSHVRLFHYIGPDRRKW
jgi:hypothetical protein